MTTLTLTSAETALLDKILNGALTSAEYTSTEDPTEDPAVVIQGILDKLAGVE